MNSLVRVFSNFKEFYSEINGATLTGAIDVIVVEQPNGEFHCSPFHVRFGKLGVLRSREKIVDIEINGEPVDIHMKLGESGEAFFVEECPEEEIEELTEKLATSPLPPSSTTPTVTGVHDELHEKDNNNDDELCLSIPRRNSIDFSKIHYDENKGDKYENQISDFKSRRHTTDISINRNNLNNAKKEYMTKEIHQDLAEKLDSLEETKEKWSSIVLKNEKKENDEGIEKEKEEVKEKNKEVSENKSEEVEKEKSKEKNVENIIEEKKNGENKTKDIKEETNNSKKRRRKKSQMKKKNAQRKTSNTSMNNMKVVEQEQEPDTISTLSSNMTGSSTDESLSSSKIEETDIKPCKEGLESETNQNLQNENQSIPIVKHLRDIDNMLFFSDTEIASSGQSPHCSRPSTPIQSDSELEIGQRKKDKNSDDEMLMNTSSAASWKWGELPQTEEQNNDIAQEQQRNSMLSRMFSFMKKTNKMRKSAGSTAEGIYLSDLDPECLSPEMAALYFPSYNKDNSLNITQEEDRESGNGTSVSHSPSPVEGDSKCLDFGYDDGKAENKYLDFVAISLCGGTEKDDGPSDEEFERHLVKYSDICQNPEIFSSPDLVVRLNGKYYSWSVACPVVMTMITFQKPLSDEVIEHLMHASKTSLSQKTDGVDSIVNEEVDGETSGIKGDIDHEAVSSDSNQEKKRGYSWWSWRRSGGNENKRDGSKSIQGEHHDVAEAVSSDDPNYYDNELMTDDRAMIDTSSVFPESEQIINNESTASPEKPTKIALNISNKGSEEKYRKTLRLNSKLIKSLNLKPGMNEIEFSVTTAYQGTSRCKCYLFRWKYNDKVIISDIDGTITKSDVLGHILPMVGKDWAQIGVAQLFSKIEANGYKLLYLSARAIGQSRVTREYLRSIRQGDVKLPDGPLLLNPTSLISAFHREVIEKKPEQFKIACLTDIQTLFPDNPFYAGFGNRINDVWAYRAVGIPTMRIFTINTKGELKHELTQTFQSTYCSMTYIADQLFPPIKDDAGTFEFSHFNYWRDPVPDIDINIEITLNSSSAATQDNNSTPQLSSKQLATIPEN